MREPDAHGPIGIQARLRSGPEGREEQFDVSEAHLEGEADGLPFSLKVKGFLRTAGPLSWAFQIKARFGAAKKNSGLSFGVTRFHSGTWKAGNRPRK
jgi:hypothetical protein